MLDEYIHGVVERINPDSPSVPLLKVIGSTFALGGAGNVAANVASLSGHASLYGLLGNPEEGSTTEFSFSAFRNEMYNSIFQKEATRAGILLGVAYERDTSVKQRLREREHNGYIARTDWGESVLRPISLTAREMLLSRLSQHDRLDAIVLSDYNKRVFTQGFSADIIAFAKQRNVPVFADPKPHNIHRYNEAMMIRPNEKEAREIVQNYAGEVQNYVGDIRIVGRTLYHLMRCKEVVITRGKEGMLGYDGAQFYEIPTQARSVADVTGAGDTVIAALALSRVSGASLPEAIEIANYAAGIVVEKVGTATVTREELREGIMKR